MRRSSIVLMTGLLPLFLGVTPVAYAEAGDGASLSGIDVIGPDTVDPETNIRIAHLRIQVGAERYIDAEGLARTYGTDITSIRERNLGTTLARCRQSDGSLVRRTRHLKEPPPVTEDEVVAMRSANGLWTNCASDSKQQTLVLIQGEKLDVPRAPTAVPVRDRLKIYDELGECDTPECASALARKAGGKIPTGNGADDTTQKLANANRALEEHTQRDADAQKWNAKTDTKIKTFVKERDAARDALTSRMRWVYLLGMLGVLGFVVLIMAFLRELKDRDKKVETRLALAWQQRVVEEEHKTAQQRRIVTQRESQIELLASKVYGLNEAQRLDAENFQTLREELATLEKTVMDKDLDIAARDTRIERMRLDGEKEARKHLEEIESLKGELRGEIGTRDIRIIGLENDLTVLENSLDGARTNGTRLQDAFDLQAQTIRELEASIQASEAREREGVTREEQLNVRNTELSEELATCLRMIGERNTTIVGLNAEIDRLREPIAVITEHELGTPNAEFREQILLMVASILAEPYRMITGKEFPVLALESNTGLDLAEIVDEMSNAMKTGAEAFRLRALHEVTTGLVGLGMVIDGNPLIEVDGEFNCEARMEQLRKALARVVDRINAMLRRSNPPPAAEVGEDETGNLIDVQTARENQSLLHLIGALEDRVHDMKSLPNYEDESSTQLANTAVIPVQSGYTKRPTPMGLGQVMMIDQDPERIAAFGGLKLGCELLTKRVGVIIETQLELDVLLQLAWVCQEQTFHCFNNRGGTERVNLASLGSEDYRRSLRVGAPAV